MSAQDVYNRLRTTPLYHPASAEVFDDLTLQAGDVVVVASDRVNYTLPIFSQHITWNGSAMTTIESTGKEKREPLSALRRKQFAQGRSGYTTQQDLQEVIYSTDFTRTDRGIGLLAKAVGVKIDANTGLPSVNAVTGDYEFDEDGATLTGQINVTAGAISAEIVTARNGESSLKSALDLKTNSASLSTIVDSNGNVTAASVVTAVNNSGSSVLIDAGKVVLSATGGTTFTLSDKYAVINSQSFTNSNLYVSGDIYAKTPNGNYHGVAGNLIVPDGCNLYFNDGNSNNVILSASKLSEMLGGILDVQISGPTSNNYTLQLKRYGDTTWTDAGTFSRATTLSGAWASGVYTVSASPQGNTNSTTLHGLLLGAATKGTGSTVETTYDIGWQEIVNGEARRGGTTGKTGTISLDVSGLLQAKSVSPSQSSQTITPDNDKLGLSQVTIAGSTLSGAWDGNVLTVTASPQNQSHIETMGISTSPAPSGGASSTTIDNFSSLHMATLTITASSITAAGGTYWKQFEIDASGVYTEGINAAKPVTIATPTWDKSGVGNVDGTNLLTISASSAGGGSDTASVAVQLTADSWSSKTREVKLYNGATLIGLYTVDATGIYEASEVSLAAAAAGAPTYNSTAQRWYSTVDVTKTLGATTDTESLTVDVQAPYTAGAASVTVGNPTAAVASATAETTTTTITATGSNGASGSSTLSLTTSSYTDSSSVTHKAVQASIGGNLVAMKNVDSVWNAGARTAWLSQVSAAGSNHQGTLASNTYYCPRYQDANGNIQTLSNYTWLTPTSSSTSHSVTATSLGTFSSRSGTGGMDEAAADDNNGTTPSIVSLGSNGGSSYMLIRVRCGTSKKYYFVH